MLLIPTGQLAPFPSQISFACDLILLPSLPSIRLLLTPSPVAKMQPAETTVGPPVQGLADAYSSHFAGSMDDSNSSPPPFLAAVASACYRSSTTFEGTHVPLGSLEEHACATSELIKFFLNLIL